MTESTITPTDLLSRLRDLSDRLEGSLQGLSGEAPHASFSEVLKQSLDQVNEIQQAAASLGRAYETGDPSVSVTDLMVAKQKSSVAFQATLQVRNKLVSAYQEIMSMPV